MSVSRAGAPTRDAVRDWLVALLEEITSAPRAALTEAATLDALALDSVTFVELQVAIEDEWHIELDAIEVVELNALGPIVDYVHARIRERSA